MDQVKIRANLAAHGLKKDAEVTVAETPLVAGAISNGVFIELERYPAEPEEVSDPEEPIVDIPLPDVVTDPVPPKTKRG